MSESDFYLDLITPPDTRELDKTERQRAADIARTAMASIEEAISRGLVANVEVSFEIVAPGAENPGFNFSSPSE